MPNCSATANTVAQPLFTVPLNMKGKIDAIKIDNGKGTHGRIQFKIRDSFFQDVSINNNVVNARYAEPWVASVPQNEYFSENVLSLEKIELMGVVTLIADAIDALVPVNIQFHFE